MVQNDLERVTDRSEEYESYAIILWIYLYGNNKQQWIKSMYSSVKNS